MYELADSDEEEDVDDDDEESDVDGAVWDWTTELVTVELTPDEFDWTGGVDNLPVVLTDVVVELTLGFVVVAAALTAKLANALLSRLGADDVTSLDGVTSLTTKAGLIRLFEVYINAGGALAKL